MGLQLAQGALQGGAMCTPESGTEALYVETCQSLGRSPPVHYRTPLITALGYAAWVGTRACRCTAFRYIHAE